MIEQLITEATECDFKVALEIKKLKIWLKSVSAFSNNQFYDTLITDALKKDYSFTLLEATYLERTGLYFEPSDYVSFGLADKNGFLTNAGKLLTDQHTFYNSRMFCTRWNGLEKGSIFDDALDDNTRVIGQNVLMANPSHQTFCPHYVSRSIRLHHPR